MKYYFAKQGDIFTSEDPANPGLENTLQAREMLQWEKDAFLATMGIYEQVTDLKYIEVDNRADADIKIIIYQGTPGAGASLLGRMSPPGEQNEGQTEINAGDYRWTEEGVSPGGFFFPTLLHEFGHGHGMKHPHDNGGGGPEMEGAGPSDDPVEGAIGGQYGAFGLSQQVYTVMSYNDGWDETGGVGGRPAGHGGPRSGGLTMQADHFGWQGTLAALDIALLQDKYGVNEEWATGDDVYTIADTNGAGNYYRTIWDGGGTDEIRYVGSRDATIDLRAATLEYEEGGGGRMSFAMGAWTGFTIANGVAIERATGGAGNDTLTGNALANLIIGGFGDDVLAGHAGVDTLNGGFGRDTADYSDAASAVTVKLKSGRTTNDGDGASDSLISIEDLIGSAFNDFLTGDDSANRLAGGDGRDTLTGLGGDDILTGGGGDDVLNGGAGVDVVQLTGVRTDYVVTAGSTAGTYRLSDLLAGRDGVDTASQVEFLRFSDGTTVSFADAMAPGTASAPTQSAKSGDEPQVLPDVDEGLPTLARDGLTATTFEPRDGDTEQTLSEFGELPDDDGFLFATMKDSAWPEVLPAMDDGFILTDKFDDVPPVMPTAADIFDAGGPSITEMEMARDLLMSLARENPLNNSGDSLTLLDDWSALAPHRDAVWA